MQTGPSSSERIAAYRDFWPYYLSEHRHPLCRRLHYVGTTLTFPFFAAALVTLNPAWLIGAPLVGYFFAWVGHFFIEKNKPATFKYPLWSLISDYRMFFVWIGGKTDQEYERFKLRPTLP